MLTSTEADFRCVFERTEIKVSIRPIQPSSKGPESENDATVDDISGWNVGNQSLQIRSKAELETVDDEAIFGDSVSAIPSTT